MRLSEICQQNALQDGEKTFLTVVANDESVSYAQLHEEALLLTQYFTDLDLKPGERIALIARNEWIFFPLLIAASVRSLIVVPLDPALNTAELTRTLNHAQPALTVLGDSFTGSSVPSASATFRLSELRKKLDGIQLAKSSLVVSSASTNAGLLLIYTSGTTGDQKGVLLSEQNLLSCALTLRDFYQIQASDRFFCFLPTYHMNAVMITGLIPICARAQIFLGEPLAFTNAKFVWEDFARYGITIASLTPSIMTLFLDLFSKGPSLPHSLRFAFCGTAPLTPKLWQNFESVFGVAVYQGYGLTETTCWLAATPPDKRKRYDSVGLPLGQEVEIRDGEIVVRGSFVLREYFRNPTETTRTIEHDGFFHTGDLGRIDGDGQLVVTGRIKEIIIRGGINIASREIDDVLSEHPGILECKSFGIPDRLLGERAVTAYALKPGIEISPTELRTWLNERLSARYRPDELVVIDSLPRTPSGKISLRRLIEMFSGI